jgi:hypothetical protein
MEGVMYRKYDVYRARAGLYSVLVIPMKRNDIKEALELAITWASGLDGAPKVDEVERLPDDAWFPHDMEMISNEDHGH